MIKCGSPGYVAPEVLKGSPNTTKGDIFSLGSLMFNLITGKNLFSGRNIQEILLANKFNCPKKAIHIFATNVS